MASDIQHDSKSTDVIETQKTDLDFDSDLLEQNDELKKEHLIAEQQELTPVEAFKWNVEGDQSPCEMACLSCV